MTVRTCRTCDGTGWLLARRSWFAADGFRRYRCGICGGSGESAYRAADYEHAQRRFRAEAVTAMKAAAPVQTLMAAE